MIAISVAIGISAYDKFTSTNNSYGLDKAINGRVKAVTGKVENSKIRYKCDGGTYCSQMTSCEEAEFFITHCPGTKMDGDNDGKANGAVNSLLSVVLLCVIRYRQTHPCVAVLQF
ncbi:MAG: excalibur calcium-binding domain-containing protein [Gammaproteobacteria bacterium]